MPKNKISLLAAAVFVVGATLIYGMSAMIKDGNAPSAGDMIAHAPVHEMAGTVNAIGNGGIQVQGQIGGGVALRTIVTTDQTAVKALVPLSGKELRESMDRYREGADEGAAAASPIYKEVLLSPEDLRLTMQVSVSSKDDLRTSDTVTADQITFLAPPSTPPGT